MKLSIFTTVTNPVSRKDTWLEAMDCYQTLADEVVVINGGYLLPAKNLDFTLIRSIWPKEFDWSFIGQQFQRGYEACTGDWVLHCDLDFIFHEVDYERIREKLENSDAPGIAFYKRQFIQPDRFNVKSRLVIAVNKRRYGDRIRFDGGQDLCQPTLDGGELKPDYVPQVKIPIYNYECILKTKEQLLEDKGRFARAWQRTFGEYKLGGPDDESAYQKWLTMVVGRNSKPQNHVRIEDHPAVMQETIKNLKPEQWGYDGFGNFTRNDYV